MGSIRKHMENHRKRDGKQKGNSREIIGRPEGKQSRSHKKQHENIWKTTGGSKENPEGNTRKTMGKP